MKFCCGALFVLTSLTACEGGLYLGYNGDDPPSVSLAIGTASAVPGQTLQLAAAASDDDFVDEVDFYRLEANGSATFLGFDSSDPYRLNAVMPSAAAGTTVYFFARAFDSVGQSADSALVGIVVQ